MRSSHGHDALTPDELALASVPLAHEIVDDLLIRIDEPIDREDLLSSALVAMLDAAQAFDPDRDGPFDGYATAWVRSALMAEVRSFRMRAVQDRLPVEPAVDEPDGDRVTDLVQAIQELAEWEHSLAEIAEPTLVEVGQLIAARSEQLLLVREAIELRGAEQAARSAAYAALVGRRAQAQRSTGAAQRLRRDA